MGKVSVYVTPVAVEPPKLVKFTGTCTVLPASAVAGALSQTVTSTSDALVSVSVVSAVAVLFARGSPVVVVLIPELMVNFPSVTESDAGAV